MPSKHSTQRQPASQPATNDQHEVRYSKNREKLCPAQLKSLIDTICATSVQSANALLLLLDEIERSQYDRVYLDDMLGGLIDHAFGAYSLEASRARVRYLASARRGLLRKESRHAA